MSIVGCYSMDLYCDNGGEPQHNYRVKFPHQFTGHTHGECTKDARAAGWKLFHKENKAYCPLCVEQQKIPKVRS